VCVCLNVYVGEFMYVSQSHASFPQWVCGWVYVSVCVCVCVCTGVSCHLQPPSAISPSSCVDKFCSDRLCNGYF